MESKKYEYINELAQKLRKIQPKEDLSLKRLAVDKLTKIAKNKGYDSPTSKKAISFLNNRSFATEFEFGIFVYKLYSAANKKDISVAANLIYPVKTKGGTIYAIDKGNNVFFCFSAHFFDRYCQRTKNAETRKDAIKDFLKEILMSGCLSHDYGNGFVRMFFKNGLCLGESFCDDENDNFKMNLTLFKTFVSNDMLTVEQKTSLTETIEMLKTKDSKNLMQQKFIEHLIKDDENEIL